MATYTELYGLYRDSALRNKVAVAVTEAARIVLDGEDTSDPPWDQTAGRRDERLQWAVKALNNPDGEGRRMLRYVLVANLGLTVAQIQGASDNAIQSNVNDGVDELAHADALAAV